MSTAGCAKASQTRSREVGHRAKGDGFMRIFELSVHDGIGTVTFAVPEDRVNTWTEAAIAEFSELVEQLDGLAGLILISGKPEDFHSGGDLRFLGKVATAAELEKGLELLPRAFARLASVPYPTVAAIRGHCLGGGYELALACSARIAQEAPSTTIGLPECRVGLFPGAGGTQRLPRLIGAPAVDLILQGKALGAGAAAAAGLVDRLVPAAGGSH